MMPSSRHSAAIARHGSAYVLVLGLVTLLTLSGLATVAISRARTQSVQREQEALQAEVLAESAIEHALAYIDRTPQWRTSLQNDTFTEPHKVGAGTISFKVVDEVDGDLADSTLEDVRLYGVGRVGGAAQSASVLQTGPTYSCLGVAGCVQGSINLGSSRLMGTGMTVATNSSAIAVLATIEPRIEANGTITGLSFWGGAQGGLSPRVMPDWNVFTPYLAAGTTIRYGALGNGEIANCLLSPTSNPFGDTLNASGIYVLDCLGNDVTIKDCRIVGTLVLINAGSGTKIERKVHWTPAIPSYPCLLVRGNLSLRTDGNDLKESAGKNFNPSGSPSPYPVGVADSDTTDSYPNSIGGLVYVSGDLTTSNTCVVHSIVVGGGWTNAGTLTLQHDDRYITTAPPGFARTGSIYPSSQSWRREPVP